MEPIKYYDLSYQVYEKIKNMILNDELKPGEKIKQENISQQLGVSRTPLHKAFQMLENEFLVESIPRRGIFVKNIELQQIIDVFECREGLEVIAARRIAENVTEEKVKTLRAYFEPFEANPDHIDATHYQIADREFHNAILKLSGNEILMKLDVLGNIIVRTYQRGLVRSPKETLAEHKAIIDAIEAGDAVGVEKLIRGHLNTSRNNLKRLIAEEKSIKI